MGYQLSRAAANDIFRQWAERYDIFAPRRMEGEGCSLTRQDFTIENCTSLCR